MELVNVLESVNKIEQEENMELRWSHFSSSFKNNKERKANEEEIHEEADT